jgi:hypothetical protein
MPAALNEEARDEEKAADAGNKLAHTLIHNSVQILAARCSAMSVTKNSMLRFSSSGLIESIQKFDTSVVACAKAL